MIRKMTGILLCLCLSLPCTACYNRREPKKMSVVNSVLYDLTDTGQYKVMAEVMNPTAAAGTQRGSTASNKSPSITISGEGESIREAVSDLSISLDRSLFGGHNKVRFFTETFAKEDMAPVMDFLLRDHLSDETPLMIVIRGQMPENIHFSTVGLADMVGEYMESLSKNQPNQTAESVFVTTLDFAKDYYTEGKQPVMGVAAIERCQEKTSENTTTDAKPSEGGSGKTNIILYKGLAAFKDNRLVGFMDGHEARAYNMLTKNVDTAFVSIPVGPRHIVLEIGSTKTDIKAAMSGDQVTLDIRVDIVMRVVTAADGVDVSKAKDIKEVEEKFNEKMEKEILASVHKAQDQFESDIFGFGDHFHDQHPRQWREIKDRWDELFSGADVRVTVTSSVNREGEIKQPFSMEEVDR